MDIKICMSSISPFLSCVCPFIIPWNVHQDTVDLCACEVVMVSLAKQLASHKQNRGRGGVCLYYIVANITVWFGWCTLMNILLSVDRILRDKKLKLDS